MVATGAGIDCMSFTARIHLRICPGWKVPRGSKQEGAGLGRGRKAVTIPEQEKGEHQGG